MSKLQVELFLKKEQFNKGIEAVKANVASMKNSINSSVSNLGAGMVAAIGTGAIVAGLNKAIDKGELFADLSTKFDVSAESIQRIGAAAEKNGSSYEASAASLSKLTIAQQKATNGDVELAKAFADVGVSVKELKNLNSEELFYKIADAMKEGKLAGIEFDTITTIMGKSAGDLIPTLELGSAGIRDFAYAVEIMSDDTTSDMGAVSAEIKAVQNIITNGLATGLSTAIKIVKSLGIGINDMAQKAVVKFTQISEVVQAFWRYLKGGTAKDFLNEVDAAKVKNDKGMAQVQKDTDKSLDEIYAPKNNHKGRKATQSESSKNEELEKSKKEADKLLKSKLDEERKNAEKLAKEKAEIDERIAEKKLKLEQQQWKFKFDNSSIDEQIQMLDEAIAKTNILGKTTEEELDKSLERGQLQYQREELLKTKFGIDKNKQLPEVDSLRRIGGGLAHVNYSALGNSSTLSESEKIATEQKQLQSQIKDMVTQAVTELKKQTPSQMPQRGLI